MPLDNITQTAPQASRKADGSLRAPVFYDDEVGTLTRSLNELIEQVAERTQILEKAAKKAH